MAARPRSRCSVRREPIDPATNYMSSVLPPVATPELGASQGREAQVRGRLSAFARMHAASELRQLLVSESSGFALRHGCAILVLLMQLLSVSIHDLFGIRLLGLAERVLHNAIHNKASRSIVSTSSASDPSPDRLAAQREEFRKHCATRLNASWLLGLVQRMPLVAVLVDMCGGRDRDVEKEHAKPPHVRISYAKLQHSIQAALPWMC